MQIKTIRGRLSDAETFDAAVNAALADGWQLYNRAVVPSYKGDPFLCADLGREDDDEPSCETCAHRSKAPQDQPCIECDGECSRWEPIDA